MIEGLKKDRGERSEMSPQSRLVAGIVLIIVPTVEATEPNALINLAFVAGVVLAVGLLVFGVGLIRGRNDPEQLTAAGATEGR